VREADVRNTSEHLVIELCGLAPMCDEFFKMAKFYVQDGCINVVEKSCIAVIMKMPSLAIFTIETKQGREPRNVGVVSDDCSAVAQPPEGFEGIETETSRQAKGTSPTASECCSQGLGSIFDYSDTAVCRDYSNPAHVADASIQVYWDNCLGPGRNGLCKT